MPNYKGFNKIKIAGLEVPIKGRIVFLTEQTAASSTADAMQEISVVYQVTAGKTLTILGFRIYVDATGGGTLAVYQGDTEDATTSLKATIDLPAIGVGNLYEVYRSTGIAAGKFVTIVPSTTQVIHVDMIGYES